MGTETWLLDTLRPARTTEDHADPLSALPQAEGISLQGTLGVGGSAVVRMGHQRSMDREVAVKQPRSVRARWLLVREARIGGRLEHPNILPVHDIVRNEVGDPLILMKRIQGETWERRVDQQTLDVNLGVLVQVCNAVAFAHDGGILHRGLFVAAGACVVGFLVAAAHLPLTYLCLSGACFAMAGTVFVIWGRD